MTYDLSLGFTPAVEQRRFLKHFEHRPHFTRTGREITYDNPNTGVGFFLSYKASFLNPFRPVVVSAEFTLNYFRPRYFALEAEIELSLLIAEFHPQIEDAQINGMDQGPYSPEGFFSGWDFGNVFAVHNVLTQQPEQHFLSPSRIALHMAWTWNYRRDQWIAAVKDRQLIPHIMILAVEQRPSLVAIWPLGMPALLPKVDYVMIGREVRGVQQYGLASWAEVLEVLQRAGIDIGTEPLNLRYRHPPEPIARWVAEIEEMAPNMVTRLSPLQFIDAEIIEEARRAAQEGRFSEPFTLP